MDDWAALDRALGEFVRSGTVEVREDGGHEELFLSSGSRTLARDSSSRRSITLGRAA